ncbi:ABC transporter permease subunit [Clostridium swellfunianum]|uniref:ABC transporter permease n=1 Tax=Clostridium swellfunianum TaxID=1367462 RepID=UPI00202F27A7|nr:ABC transporter permease subunit [Clostridium swellfunianum]MCM0647327.1 ABC transporter permease subunit [Clostridium swellfunianum]
MRKFIKTFKANRELLLLAAPAAIWFLIFSYLPMFGVVIAFKNLRITGKGFIKSLIDSKWVGFKNFEFLFKTSDAWIITRNTILYNLVFIVLGIVIPVCLAIMLNELLNKRMAKIYQSAMFLPYFLSWVVVSYCLFAFLSVDKGYINSLIIKFGGKPISWYSEPKYWPYILILMSQWKGIGYGTVVYLASVTGIDKTYYEAAMIDGATKWQQIKCITLPLLKPVITILFILSIGKIFNADFGLFYQLPRNSGPLYPVTNVIDTYVYRGLMSLGEMGMSSAAALYQSFVGLILILLSNYIVKKIDSENSLF